MHVWHFLSYVPLPYTLWFHHSSAPNPQIYKKDLTYDCKLRQGRVDDKNKHVSRPPFVCLGLVWMKPSCERLMPYPCSHFYFDIKFGDRSYSKEKRPGSPLLFRIQSVAKYDITVKLKTWMRHSIQNQVTSALHMSRAPPIVCPKGFPF